MRHIAALIAILVGQRIVTTEQHVVAAAAFKLVATNAAHQRVVAGVAPDPVGIGTTGEHIVKRRAVAVFGLAVALFTVGVN